MRVFGECGCNEPLSKHVCTPDERASSRLGGPGVAILVVLPLNHWKLEVGSLPVSGTDATADPAGSRAAPLPVTPTDNNDGVDRTTMSLTAFSGSVLAQYALHTLPSSLAATTCTLRTSVLAPSPGPSTRCGVGSRAACSITPLNDPTTATLYLPNNLD